MAEWNAQKDGWPKGGQVAWRKKGRWVAYRKKGCLSSIEREKSS